MARLVFAGTTALALLMTPALAQDTSTSGSQMEQAGGSAMTGNEQARESAMQSAEGAGMQDVQGMDGVFVLSGATPAGMPVYMVVSPSGELLALTAPIAAPDASGMQAGAEASAEPAPGEPAQSGYMATQTQPASPQMWDPALVEGAMRSLELGRGGVAGEVTEPVARP